MYNPRRLAQIAWDGLDDLLPALHEAYFESDSRQHLAGVYGSSPLLVVAALTLGGAIVGEWFARSGPDIPFKEEIRWSAVCVAAAFAVLIRRYLFRSGSVDQSDFSWLAASLLPPFLGVLVVSLFADWIWGEVPGAALHETSTIVGTILTWATGELGILAALTIGVATLCYSRAWMHALFDLAVRLAVFKFMVWLTVLITIEIGIVGTILGALLEGLFGISFPEWMQQLADDLSYVALLTVIYLAIIGGTWTICRDHFGELLKTGHVDILSALNKAAHPEDEEDSEAPTDPPESTVDERD